MTESNSTWPLWWKLLNTPADGWSKSHITGKWQMHDPTMLDRVAPGLYKQAAGEVKEFNDAVTTDGQKVKLGKRVGSILAQDYFLRPELRYDAKALEKYYEEHPELRARNPNGSFVRLNTKPQK